MEQKNITTMTPVGASDNQYAAKSERRGPWITAGAAPSARYFVPSGL